MIQDLVLQLPLEGVINFIVNLVFFVAIYILVATALNIQYGYTGIPNFGLAFGVAVGAYVAGYVPGRLLYSMYFEEVKAEIQAMCPAILENPDQAYIRCNIFVRNALNEIIKTEPGLSTALLMLTLVIAIGAGALMGLLASIPAIRLRVDFLMMSLIAIAEGVRIIGENYEPLAGGTLGVTVPALLGWMEPMLGFPRIVQSFILVMTGTFVTMALVYLMLRSPYGRLLKAVRESEDAALAVGIDVNRVKIEAMIIGTAVAALAGAIYSFYLGNVVPTSYTRYDWTFWPWLMLLLGGRGSEVGAVVGAAGIMTLRRVISVYKHSFQGLIPFDVIWLERIALGVAFLVIMIFKPYGLFPEKPFRLKGVHELPKE